MTKIKKSDAYTLYNVVSGIRLNVVKDRETRTAVLRNYTMLKPLYDGQMDSLKEARTKMFEGRDEEVEKLEALRREYNDEKTADARRQEIVETTTNDYAELLSLEKEFKEFSDKLGEEEVEVELMGMSIDVFMDALSDSGMAFSAADMVNEPVTFIIKKEEE